jgi:hypothetical protein
MKRELRLPTKGYELLRQQVQAKRGTPTNRLSLDDSSSTGVANTDAEIGTPEAIVNPSVEPARDNAVDAPALGTGGGGDQDSGPAGSGGPEPDTKPTRRVARRAPQAPSSLNTAPSSRPMDAPRVTLKLNFTAPATGVFPFYDRVIETMPPRKAVPLLLAKAFEELEAAATRGEEIRLEEYKMERNGERISTSRTMDATTLEKLRAHIDPHNLMRLSSLGAALATSALTLYLRRHS